MRLIVRTHIYRAFPELDRHSDEQCRRFVAAARRGWGRRLRHWPLLTAASLAALAMTLLAGAASGMGVLWSLDGRDSPIWPSMVVGAGATIAAGLALLVAVFLLRDWLLRRRIRYILRARGVCANCRYTLVGLPVSAGHLVHCPECGMESSVDPALGELVLDGSGGGRYQPHPSMLPRPWVSPKRARQVKRWAIIGACVVLFGLPLLWGGYEWWLARQAAAAAAARPGAAGIEQYVKAAQAKDAPDDPRKELEGWNLFLEIVADYQAISAKVAAAAPTTVSGQPIVPDPSVLGWEPPSLDDDERREDHRREVETARRLMAELAASDLYAKLDRLGAQRYFVRPIAIGPNQPMINLMLPDLGQARQQARVAGARMFLAIEADDPAEFRRALESCLALSRVTGRQPLLIDHLVAVAIEALAHGKIRDALKAHLTPEWLDAIEAGVSAQTEPLPLAYAFEGERLFTLDTVAWIFTDPSRVRFGRFSPGGVMGMLGGTGVPMTGRLGTFEQNQAVFSQAYRRMAAAAGQERWERPPSVEPEATGLVLFDMLMPAISRAFQSRDQLELERRGLRVMLALERFRLARGTYPDGLQPLVPEFLPGLPLDPWSGKPLGYRRIDPAADPQGRGYLLYSVGADGADNRGQPPAGTAYNALGSGANGTDFIINDPER